MARKQTLSTPVCSGCQVFSKSLFRHCAAKELENFFAEKQFLAFQRNGIFFRENEDPRGVYCMYSGIIKITKQDSDRREHIVRFTRPGEIIGMHAVVGKHRYYRSAVALEPCLACFIPKDSFLRFLHQTPALLLEIMKFLCREVEEIERKSEELKRKSARQRLATLILNFKAAYGVDGSRMIHAAIGIEDLSNYLHSNRSTLYRLFNEFRREKVADYRDDRIRVLSESKIRMMAGPLA